MSSPWDNLPKSFVLEVRSLGLNAGAILGALDAGLLASFESSAPILRVLHRNALLRDAVAAMRDGVTADEWVEVLDWLFDVATMNGLG